MKSTTKNKNDFDIYNTAFFVKILRKYWGFSWKSSCRPQDTAGFRVLKLIKDFGLESVHRLQYSNGILQYSWSAMRKRFLSNTISKFRSHSGTFQIGDDSRVYFWNMRDYSRWSRIFQSNFVFILPLSLFAKYYQNDNQDQQDEKITSATIKYVCMYLKKVTHFLLLLTNTILPAHLFIFIPSQLAPDGHEKQYCSSSLKPEQMHSDSFNE